GKEVDAIAVARVEPPLLAPCHPDLLVGRDTVPLIVLDARLDDDLAGGGRLAFAAEEPLGIGDPAAQIAQPLDLLHMLVGVEAAAEALAVRVVLAREDLDSHGRLGDGLAP